MCLLLAALTKIECDGVQDSHRSALEDLSHRRRLRARKKALRKGQAAELFECERSENEFDVEGEPLEQPGGAVH